MARHRTQLLLDPPQHESLVRIAAQQERSVSDLVRQFVDWGLERIAADRDRRLAALGEVAALRRQLEARHGVDQGDPIRDAREARERQIEENVGLRRTGDSDRAP